MKLSKTIGLGFLALSLSVGAATKAKEKQKAMVIEDVEKLNDKITDYNNKRVTVMGDIEAKKSQRSFILESGGLINDEIVVIGDKDIQKKLQQFGNDAQVRVTGTVRNISVVEIEREYGWDLDPQIEIELERVKSFLVADQVELVQAEEEAIDID